MKEFPGAPFKSQQAYRNIPTNYPSRHLYGDDLSDKELDIIHFWADFGSGINQDNPKKDRWYDYNDPEDLSFCFEGLNIATSRYTDGAYPVWYGALDSEEASRAEVIYHLQRQAAVDLAPEEDYICYQRAMCKGVVEGVKISDSRAYLKEHDNLHDDPPYENSHRLGKQFKELRFEGVLYPSKRYPAADCIALFERKCVIESRVINFFTVEVYRDEITVCGESWSPPWELEKQRQAT